MEKPLVYIIEDDEIMSDLLSGYIDDFTSPKVFHDAYAAIAAIDQETPSAILLDILLTGPDGITFLNEIMSYEETAKIPIIIITSLELNIDKLENYGVVKVFNKATMKPNEIKTFVKNLVGGNHG